MKSAKETGEDMLNAVTQKPAPRREAALRGAILCLLALAVPIKPLADVVADYTCYDRHKETGKKVQHCHLPLLPQSSKGSGTIIAEFDTVRKPALEVIGKIKNAAPVLPAPGRRCTANSHTYHSKKN
jgi:hypothetical protein